jgi:hypothetical protein
VRSYKLANFIIIIVFDAGDPFCLLEAFFVGKEEG